MSKLAICIASYNDAGYLPTMLGSIFAQTYGDYHVYVSHDGSSDDTLRVLTEFQKILPMSIAEYDPTPGIGRNKNRVVALALEDEPLYVQMLDSDDFIAPEFAQAVVARMDVGDVDWAICWGKLFGDRSGYIHSRIEPLATLMSHNKRHSWGTFRAEVLRRHNYDEGLVYAEDWDLWIRLDMNGYKGDVVRQELYYKRWHENSLMANRGQEGYLEARAIFHDRYANLGTKGELTK